MQNVASFVCKYFRTFLPTEFELVSGRFDHRLYTSNLQPPTVHRTWQQPVRGDIDKVFEYSLQRSEREPKMSHNRWTSYLADNKIELNVFNGSLVDGSMDVRDYLRSQSVAKKMRFSLFVFCLPFLFSQRSLYDGIST